MGRNEVPRSSVQCIDRFSIVQVQLNVVLYPVPEDKAFAVPNTLTFEICINISTVIFIGKCKSCQSDNLCQDI